MKYNAPNRELMLYEPKEKKLFSKTEIFGIRSSQFSEMISIRYI